MAIIRQNDSTGLAPWRWSLLGLAITMVSFLWLRFDGNPADAVRLPLLAGGLLASGVGVWRALTVGRQRAAALFGSAQLESAAVVALSGVTAFLGSWALYYGADRADEWDSLRLFLAVVAIVAFIAALVLLVPRTVQKVIVSLLIVLHFVGIGAAVAGAPPGPWIMGVLWSHVYRPYLEFMYLTNAYHFYAPEPGPTCQLWMRLLYEDGKGKQYVRWIKFPDTDDDGQHQYTLALRNQRRQALVDNFSNALRTALPTQHKREQRDLQTKDSPLRGKLGVKQPLINLEIPYYRDPRFAEVPVPEYAEPLEAGKRAAESFARHVARLPCPDHPEYRFHSVKIYRWQHRILSAAALAHGVDHRDLTTYLPYYQGQFNAQGKLMDEGDPFLYWIVPILRDEPMNPNSLIRAYVFKHAGDLDWIKKPRRLTR